MYLFSYVIDHSGDPQYDRSVLSLGKGTCKPDIRKHASIGDWVIATLGKNFLEENKESFQNVVGKQDYRLFLVYAMKVTRKERNILYSKNFHVFNKLLKIPEKFHIFIKRGRYHKRFPHENRVSEIKLIESFIRWLEKNHKEKPHIFNCKKVCNTHSHICK